MSNIGIEKRIRTNLKRLRLGANLDKNGLARRSGVTHVAQIESGARAVGRNTLVKLAMALGCDISEFYLPVELTWGRDMRHMLIELYTAASPTGRKLIEEVSLAVARYENSKKNF